MKIIIIMIMSFFMLFSAQGADPKTNWAKNCMQCHGPDGSAKTGMGKALNAKDLTDAQIQSSFTDAEEAAAITDGVTKDGITRMLAFGGKPTDDDNRARLAY